MIRIMADLDWVIREARERRPLAPGSFRVIVGEWNGKNSSHDFSNFEDARAHADDAASEAEVYPSPLAYVLDSAFNIVDRGKHYALRLSSQR
jgi:hypothetical protein